jgi:putative NADPH-quinone reductase
MGMRSKKKYLLFLLNGEPVQLHRVWGLDYLVATICFFILHYLFNRAGIECRRWNTALGNHLCKCLVWLGYSVAQLIVAGKSF